MLDFLLILCYAYYTKKTLCCQEVFKKFLEWRYYHESERTHRNH